MLSYTSLFYPRLAQMANRVRRAGRRGSVRALIVGTMGLLFWAAIFTGFYRVLYYFNSVPMFGSVLAEKLLTMALLTFFSILIFSSVIAAISSFFMSEELQLLVATPFDLDELYYVKLCETVLTSSWMILLFSLPVFVAYGVVFEQSVAYYVAMATTLVPFLLIAVVIGIAIALCLVKSFPAQRLKDVLFLFTLFLVIGLYVLFRMLKPERLVDPDAFFTVMDYLTSLEAPTSAYLPSQWLSDILGVFLFGQDASGLVFNLLLLWSTAVALVVLLNLFFNRIFFTAWSKAQESRPARVTSGVVFDRLVRLVTRPFSARMRVVIDKDFRTFFRDTAQWSQLFLLCAIIGIYLYNFSVLPLDKSPIPTRQLRTIFSFLNMGLAGFVISAVAVRFAYPAVSLEGLSFWIIRSSPMGLRGLLWCKFWVNFVFLALLAVILTVCSNYFLRVEPYMMVLSTVTVLFMTFGLTSLSVGFGAMYPRFRYENVAQIPNGFGGLMYMMSSVLFIGTIVVLEALPMHLLVMADYYNRTLGGFEWFRIVLSFFLILLVGVIVFVVPMRVGLRRLEEMETL
jgi:ABC-2 type transport system permease protein